MAVSLINPHFGLITLQNTAVEVSFSDPREISTGGIEKVSYKGQKNGVPIRYWGRQNDLPNFREQLVADNNITGELIKTKRDITIGTGLFAYKKVFKSDGGRMNIVEVPTPKESADFFDEINAVKYMQDAAKNYYMHANTWTEFILNRNGTEITGMHALDSKYVRLGEQNNKGKIMQAYISGSWARGAYGKDGETEADRIVAEIPMYRPDIKAAKYILHTGDSLINDGYYNSPTWWGALSWIELAISVPAFHQANIMNGYSIRFHIKIPKNYFYTAPLSTDPDAENKARDLEIQRRTEFLQNMNDILAGKENAGRAVWTEFEINDTLGKEFPGISIEPIKYDMHDSALLALWDKSNAALISAQGIHPTLANVETQGRLSSGSELRNAYNIWLAVRANTPRQNLLQAINHVKKVNKWDPDICFGFGDAELTTLDDSPTGIREGTAPAADAA